MISLKEIIKNILGIINNYLKKMVKEMSEKAIQERFDEKLEELKELLPPLGRNIGNSCAAQTLMQIIDVLGIKDLKGFYFNNLAIPFSGFGTYSSEDGWSGPCGVVSGSMAAIGIIMGGNEELNPREVPNVYMKAIRFAAKFEEKFGSVRCKDICGFDLAKQAEYEQYKKQNIWVKKCQHFVLFAVDQVRRLTRTDLKRKWT